MSLVPKWSSISYVVTLAAIIGIGYLGHASHWTFAAGGDHAQAVPIPTETNPTQASRINSPDSKWPLIAFPSVDEARLCGVSSESVSVQDVMDEIRASAVVTYDESRLAHLAPRSPGHVWKVMKRLGQKVHQGEIILLVDSKEVGDAKAAYLQEAVFAQHKERLLQRLKTLANGGVVPERILLEAEAAVQEAQLKRFNARQRLENFGLPVNIAHTQNQSSEELAEKIQFLGIPAEIVEAMNPKPHTANLIPMIAPFDGVVVQQQAVFGKW